MPLSRIVARCAIARDITYHFDFGEDRVCVCVCAFIEESVGNIVHFIPSALRACTCMWQLISNVYFCNFLDWISTIASLLLIIVYSYRWIVISPFTGIIIITGL